MDKERDAYLSSIESTFGVITNEHDVGIVTNAIGFDPTSSRQKGDSTHSVYSSELAIAQHGIWRVSKTTVAEEPDLKEHVQFFRELLSDKVEQIEELRKQYSFEFVFYVLITTEDTVSGFDLSADDLAFIGKVSDRFTLRFCSNMSAEDFRANLK